MAKEAIAKIKSAEAEAAEILGIAAEKANHIMAESKKNALDEKESIIRGAQSAKEAAIENAKKEARARCAPIIADGRARAEKILNPDAAAFEQAVNTVVERIVNLNGNR